MNRVVCGSSWLTVLPVVPSNSLQTRLWLLDAPEQEATHMAETLGELEQLILLAILRLGPDAYGLSIARELEGRADRRLSRGALYGSLDRLEEKGLVRWQLAPGGPERQTLPKRVYIVLPRGIAAVRASERVLRRMWRGLEHVFKGQS
jgi:DNA-binding PadR family transcriptional regulator